MVGRRRRKPFEGIRELWKNGKTLHNALQSVLAEPNATSDYFSYFFSSYERVFEKTPRKWKNKSLRILCGLSNRFSIANFLCVSQPMILHNKKNLAAFCYEFFFFFLGEFFFCCLCGRKLKEKAGAKGHPFLLHFHSRPPKPAVNQSRKTHGCFANLL